MAEIKDFTPKHSKLEFRIDDDVFIAPRDIPAFTLMEFADKAEAMHDDIPSDKQKETITDLFKIVLTPKSYELFIERLGSNDNPIGLATMLAVIEWLMEEYGLRPTKPPVGSSDGLPNQESGMSYPETLPVTALTSVPSQ